MYLTNTTSLYTLTTPEPARPGAMADIWHVLYLYNNNTCVEADGYVITLNIASVSASCAAQKTCSIAALTLSVTRTETGTAELSRE